MSRLQRCINLRLGLTPSAEKLPKLLDQITVILRYGMKKGLMPPAYLLPEAARQTEQVASGSGEASPFAQPLKTSIGGLYMCGASTLSHGVMGATAFVSMWVSNTATAAMMVPIALSIVDLSLARRTGRTLAGHGGIQLPDG